MSKEIDNAYKAGKDEALKELESKVEKLQEYYYHNTDEETSEITYKTLDDVLELIEDIRDE